MEGRPQPAALEGGRRHWCILGAGPSGLVAMKELREVRRPDCFCCFGRREWSAFGPLGDDRRGSPARRRAASAASMRSRWAGARGVRPHRRPHAHSAPRARPSLPPPARPPRPQVGIATTCFELLPRLGGVFAKSYDGLLMTSSNVITQFSSYSDGEEAAPRHWTGPEYLAYLEAFAARYGLEDGIRFRTRVLDVRRCDASGKWLVTYRHEPAQPDGDGGAAPPAAGTATEAFDGVAVCAGAHNWPRAPPVEGAERFGGPIIHSAEVKDMAPFAGKRVAVIGAGESGSDLANMVSKVAASVCVVVRGAHGHLIARNAAVGAGHPNDMNTNRCGGGGGERAGAGLPLLSGGHAGVVCGAHARGACVLRASGPPALPTAPRGSPLGGPLQRAGRATPTLWRWAAPSSPSSAWASRRRRASWWPAPRQPRS